MNMYLRGGGLGTAWEDITTRPPNNHMGISILGERCGEPGI
jgi:hypothetical protein